MTSSLMTIRVGELDADGTATARRHLAADERTVVDLTQSGDGAVVVPVEFVDPELFGGACTGGAIDLFRTAATTNSTATCNGVDNVALDVTSSVGASEKLDLDTGVTVDAVPLSITIQAANVAAARTITLWFSDDGVVRWSFPTPTGIADYDISPDGSDGLG